MGRDGFARYPSLVGRVAFITGGASGIGAEIVRHLAGQGTQVAFVDVDAEAAASLSEECRARGFTMPRFERCDLREIETLQAVISSFADEFGPITVLVNNAGDDQRHTVAEVTPEIWRERLAVNLDHYFFASQAVAPMMRDAGGGSIVCLGSITAHVGFPDVPAYAAANGAIEALTRALARDLGADAIRVNCVVPGWIATERQRELWLTAETEERLMSLQSWQEVLEPADVARLVLWLCADDSKRCTAQRWIVDGGWM